MTLARKRLAVRTPVITGDRAEVSAVLRRARLDGRLVEISDARVIGDGRVRVVTRLRSPGPKRWRWHQVRPWLVGAMKVAGVGLVLAAVAGLLWVSAWAVMALVTVVAGAVAWVHAHLVEIGVVTTIAVIGALSAFSSSSGDRCTGAHCRGWGR